MTTTSSSRVALVTGAGSGIGRATAHAFVAAGARVALCDIDEPRMDVQVVADAVVYMAGLPLDANVLFMTVMATKMPFVGRG